MNGSLHSTYKRLMKRKSLVLVLSAVFVCLCGASLAALASNTQVPSAAGSGQCNDTILTFSAVQHTSGLVTGIAQQHDIMTGLKTTIDVTCICVNNNKARIGGTVLRTTDAYLNIGTFLVFDVVDNGEGSKATADEFNRFHLGFGYSCGGSDSTFPSERGNIQVRGGS